MTEKYRGLYEFEHLFEEFSYLPKFTIYNHTAVMVYLLKSLHNYSGNKNERVIALNGQVDTAFVSDNPNSLIDYFKAKLPTETFRLQPAVLLDNSHMYTADKITFHNDKPFPDIQHIPASLPQLVNTWAYCINSGSTECGHFDVHFITSIATNTNYPCEKPTNEQKKFPFHIEYFKQQLNDISYYFQLLLEIYEKPNLPRLIQILDNGYTVGINMPENTTIPYKHETITITSPHFATITKTPTNTYVLFDNIDYANLTKDNLYKMLNNDNSYEKIGGFIIMSVENDQTKRKTIQDFMKRITNPNLEKSFLFSIKDNIVYNMIDKSEITYTNTIPENYYNINNKNDRDRIEQCLQQNYATLIYNDEFLAVCETTPPIQNISSIKRPDKQLEQEGTYTTINSNSQSSPKSKISKNLIDKFLQDLSTTDQTNDDLDFTL